MAEAAPASEELDLGQEAGQEAVEFNHLFAGSTTSCGDRAKNLTSAVRLTLEKQQQMRNQEETMRIGLCGWGWIAYADQWVNILE